VSSPAAPVNGHPGRHDRCWFLTPCLLASAHSQASTRPRTGKPSIRRLSKSRADPAAQGATQDPPRWS